MPSTSGLNLLAAAAATTNPPLAYPSTESHHTTYLCLRPTQSHCLPGTKSGQEDSGARFCPDVEDIYLRRTPSRPGLPPCPRYLPMDRAVLIDGSGADNMVSRESP